MASTRRDNTSVSAPTASPVSSTAKVSSVILAGTSASRTASSSTLAASRTRTRPLPDRRPGGLQPVEAHEHEDHLGLGAVGHPEMVLGDRCEPAQVRQARDLVAGGQLTAESALRDRVPDRSREEPVGDRSRGPGDPRRRRAGPRRRRLHGPGRSRPGPPPRATGPSGRRAPPADRTLERDEHGIDPPDAVQLFDGVRPMHIEAFFSCEFLAEAVFQPHEHHGDDIDGSALRSIRLLRAADIPSEQGRHVRGRRHRSATGTPRPRGSPHEPPGTLAP